MILHCDECGKALGTYLYGAGGVSEIADITYTSPTSLPDIVCFECLNLQPQIAITVLEAEERERLYKKNHYFKPTTQSIKELDGK